MAAVRALSSKDRDLVRKGKNVVSGRGNPEKDEQPIGCKELQKLRYYLGKMGTRSESRKPNGDPVHENSCKVD